jgi:hypothetical protein
MALGDVQIRSRLLPQISFNALPAAAGLPGEQPQLPEGVAQKLKVNFLKLAQPSISVDIGSFGGVKTWAPYGEPASNWFIVLTVIEVAALVALGILIARALKK